MSVNSGVEKDGLGQQQNGSDLSEKMVYYFGSDGTEGKGDMRDTLGGKGAALAEMCLTGIPVPPGFTISTQVCNLFYSMGGKLPESYDGQQVESLRKLEEAQGKKLGDPNDPLLVSVRSGAKFSMPGMMDTILNLGINDESVKGLAAKTGNNRFAFDSYRRFLQMFGDVVLGIPKDTFEKRLTAMKQAKGVEVDLDLDENDLISLVAEYKGIIEDLSGNPFPQDPLTQLNMARNAVFQSWYNDRAVFYRKQNNIPDDLGTAVNVQAMVFGNMGDNCATGVGFTRNPATGEKEFYGEYLRNAQGEDVVAGTRTPRPILELEADMPKVYGELREITNRLELHYRDIQDFEFTVQDGTLFMLQTRSGKRTAQAAVKIAVDMVAEGLITKEEALLRVDPTSLDQLLHPRIDESASYKVLARGLAASPGAAVGRIAFDPDDAVTMALELEDDGLEKKVVLVRRETSPDDIHGMSSAIGILTATGGMTSHAAVVARGMGKSCVAGCSAAVIHEEENTLKIGDVTLGKGDFISLNGSTGDVIAGKVATIEPEVADEFRVFMEWADKERRLGVRTNADTPDQAEMARRFGAEGIGLCRTEHMFFAEDRLPYVQQMIIYAPIVKKLNAELSRKKIERESAVGEYLAALNTEIEKLEKNIVGPQAKYQEALDIILPFQREDFYGILKAMKDLPVTIRTLDPPLHEFLPKREELMVEIALMKERKAPQADIDEKTELLGRVEDLSEVNPMLGHRGCRLGIAYPEITIMQARAIIEAAVQLAKEKIKVYPEIMIPLVGSATELAHQRNAVERIARQIVDESGVKVDYLIGTMIEVPRAALTADQVAAHADFFSFGTNDLTQMTFGFSRDDAGKFLPEYVDEKILPHDPFVSLDRTGVGQLVKMAVEKGRGVKEGLKTGICGEHGGDPYSVEFCHRVGLNYVSCSPFRVPIARLAAAQAVINEKAEGGAGFRGQL
jgi:pyruvate, orthophosphate dikinase